MDINKKEYSFAMGLQLKTLNVEGKITIHAPKHLPFKYAIGVVSTAKVARNGFLKYSAHINVCLIAS